MSRADRRADHPGTLGAGEECSLGAAASTRVVGVVVVVVVVVVVGGGGGGDDDDIDDSTIIVAPDSGERGACEQIITRGW